MAAAATPPEAELVECEVCLKEVPKMTALDAAADDRTVYFCSPECYEEWSDEEIRARTQEAGEP
jgi:YHS domain-containing protein